MAKHLPLVRAANRIARQPVKRLPIEWLSYAEMAKIVVERLDCGDGQAKGIIRQLYISQGLIQPYQTWVKIEGLSFPSDQFRDWLSRRHPKPRAESLPSRRQTNKEIGDLVAEYMATTPKPSVHGLEAFAKERGIAGHRDQLRAELKRQTGRDQAGRPRK
jgi:hypothetical protein